MRRFLLRSSARHFWALLVCLLFTSVLLKPTPAQAWWNGDWSARKAITIDTSAAGAGITDPIGTTPVLIRLDVSDFSFDAANPDGSDLRFVAADDKTPLAYHIEKYDNLLGQAFVWVSVPDVKPGAQTNLFLYYGNKKATAADDAKGTYDANDVLLYHFADKGAAPHDASGHGNNATTAGQSDDFAIIGAGMRLDGQATVALPVAPTLAWSGGNAMTWSIWFNETATQPNAILYSRTDGTNTVQIGVNNSVPFVSVNGQTSNGTTPAAAASWHSLVVLAVGSQMTLYVDGSADGTLSAALPALNTAATLGGDATTGAAPVVAPDATTPPTAATTTTATATATTTTGFIGSVDELEISNIARPLGYVKFAAIGQGNNPLAGKLLSYAAEEKPASWFSGPFVVILGSVTLDGWVIIAILSLMAVTSWIVMADKISYVNRITKANAAFVEEFRSVGADLTALDNRTGAKAPAGNLKVLKQSPLYHIYHLGAEEIRKRFAGTRGQQLSAQSIAAIRSTLDGGLVRETQTLNKSMVLLTIAIAGGPFLGLLGTVVGVMITFASIAAAGNVNVNAIAPGISAALVATVAGLVVAIPALFGYNYLNSRIGNGVSDMEVFVDEFVTKMAEHYSPRTVDTLAAE